MGHRFRVVTIVMAFAVSGFGPFDGGAAYATERQPAQRVAKAAGPEVYLLRGFGDVFSRGLDQMGATLLAKGIDAHVQGHLSWQGVARRIIEDRRRNGRSPVILVGHSLGANAVIKVAERLAKENIAVDQLITLAATAPGSLPPNVRHATNYYFAAQGWGRPLTPGTGFRGRLYNKDYSHVAEVGHFNIDKQRSVQAEILSLVIAAARR